jgi:hypothetical protein
VRCAAVIFVRSRLAEAARAGVDQARIDFFQVIVTEAEFFHLSRMIVLDHHIGFGNQLAGQFHAAFGFQIEHDALLIDVDPQEFVGIYFGVGLHP